LDEPDKPDLDRDWTAGVTPVHLDSATPEDRLRRHAEEVGYWLYLPRPEPFAVALWIWLLISAAYIVISAMAGYIRFFQLPDGESEFYRLVPGPPDRRFWIYLGLGIGLNCVRLVVVVTALRSDQGSTWIRLGWSFGLASAVYHPADFLWKLGARISSFADVRTSPAPVAVAGVVSLVLLALPSVLRWVWRSPEYHLPDWTYSEGQKPSEELRENTAQVGEESPSEPKPD
jgi:hypothetical protein